jgi:Mg-chelatase subunit ChlD
MSVSIEASTDGPLPASGGVSTVEVTIDTTAKSVAATRHVVLLVDTSASMSGEKIERARTGAKRVLDELNGDDYVSLLGFTTGVDVVLPMTRWADVDEADVYDAVVGSGDGGYDGELVASRGTRIPNALEAAKQQFTTLDEEGVSKDLILLSDGHDERDIEVYERLASELADEGVSVSAGGIGDYNADVMLALSRASGGESYDLDDADEIDTFLEERIEEARKVVAPTPEVEVEVADRFWLDTDADVYFTEPQAQAQPIEATPNGGRFSIPRVTAGKRQRFSFEVRASRKRTGPEYHMLDLTVVGDGPLAETSVSVEYAENPPSKTSVTKRRESAKIVCDVTDTGDAKVEAAIDELERRGMAGKARQLRRELNDGGKVGASKALVDDGAP